MNSKQFADRVGNIDDRLVHRAGNTPNYGRQNRRRGFRRFLTAAVAAALMVASFTVGAMAFSTETIVEVPAKQEIIKLEDLGITLILPDSWAGQYQVVPWDNGQYAVVCPEVRQAMLAWTRQEFEDGGLEWSDELDENPFTGGMLFYIAGIPEVLTPEQVEDSSWSFAEYRYLFATAERTYLLYYASDVQSTPDTREQYQALELGIRDIQIIINNVIG